MSLTTAQLPVQHYEELTELLRGQVGVPPAPETTALYRRLSTGG